MQTTATVVFDSFKSLRGQVDIQVDGSNIKVGSETLSLDMCIGVQHTTAYAQHPKPGVCADPVLVQLTQQVSPVATGYWMLYFYELVKKDGVLLDPKLRLIKFQQDSALCDETVQDLRKHLMQLDPERKILFLLNPAGGQGKAKKIYHEVIYPLIVLAGLEQQHELVETTHQNHGYEIALNLDTQKYQSIAPISGDGVFHEIVNGFLHRKDYQQAIERVLICTVGTGSSNAIGQNLDIPNPELCVLALIKNQKKKMDAFAVIQNQEIIYSHLSVSWAFVADIDIESDRFRSLGPLRFTLAAIVRLLRLRTYFGQVYMLPPEKASEFASQPEDGPPLHYISLEGERYKQWPIQRDTSFQMLVACNLPWISRDNLWSPMTHQDDGLLNVTWSEEMTFSAFVSALLKGETGEFHIHDAVKSQKVLAFALDPSGYIYGKSPANSRRGSVVSQQSRNSVGQGVKGILNVSGEMIPYAPIQVEILPQILNVVSPPWMDTKRWETKFNETYGDRLQRILS
ncbi:ATP-NAD kinase-like domain-containing protein [Gorgonomyces haynaldii]|nr:ATP-NAD kinase-like domain-containing protein [Gorgonomyces haynaldii]